MSTLATVIYNLRNLLSTDDEPDVQAARALLHSELVEAAVEAQREERAGRERDALDHLGSLAPVASPARQARPRKLAKRTRFPEPQPIRGPGDTPGVWNIDLYISDRWGDTDPNGLWLPHDVAERLRSKMWDEVCFMAEKDGKLGVLFEVEKATVESIKWFEPDVDQVLLKGYRSAEVLPRVLCKALPLLSAEFPGVEFAIGTSELDTLGALLWGFVADDLNMDAATCERLGRRLLYLNPNLPEKQPPAKV